MFTLLVTLLAVIFVSLVLVAAVRPKKSEISLFELERRSQEGDKSAMALLRREQLLPDIASLQRIKIAILLVIFVATSVAVLGWLIGTLVAAFVALEYGAVARLRFFVNWADKLYAPHEPFMLRFVEKYANVLRFIRNSTLDTATARLSSKQELSHLVEASDGVLSNDEKKLITNGIGFNERKVREIMTPRSAIDSISKKELLGPLVLDDLHKTGHSRFPVTAEDIDHIVGMIHIQDLLTLDGGKRSTTVEKAMEPQVFYIHEEQSLQHALAAFLRTHHHLFVVVNEFRETVGLISLEDVIEALLGRKIIDEFDTHEDLRVVATRNPRGNNKPESHTDV